MNSINFATTVEIGEELLPFSGEDKDRVAFPKVIRTIISGKDHAHVVHPLAGDVAI